MNKLLRTANERLVNKDNVNVNMAQQLGNNNNNNYKLVKESLSSNSTKTFDIIQNLHKHLLITIKESKLAVR